MRIELQLGDKTYWADFKEPFTRRETKQWYDAQDLRLPVPEEKAADAEKKEPDTEKKEPEEPKLTIRERALLDSENRMLELLSKWCSSCYLEDVAGNAYNSISELSSDVLDDFDWAVLDFLFNVPLYARAKRGRLGEVVGLPLSRTARV